MHVYDLAREVQELREEVRRLREGSAAHPLSPCTIELWPRDTAFPRS